MKRKLYQQLASLIQARANCEKAGNREWYENHTKRAKELTDAFLPSGSGFDSGTDLDFDASTGEKLIFYTSYHHMNDVGMYDGWTEHRVIVTPSLQFEYNLRITGRDRNQIKDYMYEVFRDALDTEVE